MLNSTRRPRLVLVATQLLCEGSAFVRNIIIARLIGVDEMGLAVALAECCMGDHKNGVPLGASVEMKINGAPEGILFGEDQSRLLITTPREYAHIVLQECVGAHVYAEIIGEVQKDTLQINKMINLRTSEMAEVYMNSLEGRLG